MLEKLILLLRATRDYARSLAIHGWLPQSYEHSYDSEDYRTKNAQTNIIVSYAENNARAAE